MSSVTLLERTILQRLEARPSWSRSPQHVKPAVERLVKAGLVERFKPPTGTATNMLRITEAGVDLLEGRPSTAGEAWTQEQEHRFFDAIADGATITFAGRLVGKSRDAAAGKFRRAAAIYGWQAA